MTSRIGLVPSVTVTHTEPFHVSKAIATLDYVSSGRAGVRVQVSARPDEAAHFGRRTFPLPNRAGRPGEATGAGPRTCSHEAADYVEVLRRLWDSWEDDAEIRDVSVRAVHRPGEAALHRLHGSMVLGQGAVDHAPAAAGPAPR